MATMRPTYKFKTNIPTDVFFQSNEPQTGTGKYGLWYRYDVLVDSIEQVIFVSRVLQNMLASLGNLYGRTVEITKKEGENNRIFWEIKEQGDVVTPALSSAEMTTKDSSESLPVDERVNALERRVNTASAVVKELIDRMQRVEKDLEELRERAGMRAEAGASRYEE